MPRDPRLYTTFPIDMHRHPKLRNQPAEVKWAFIEMNGEARIADNDGRFTAEDAEFLWPREILDALVRTHPSRPLVYREENSGDYVIRDYAEHQETRATRQARAEKNRANGAKGGRPRKNPPATDSKPSGFLFGSQSLANQTHKNPESESESEDLTKTSESQSLDTRASVSTDAVPISAMTKRIASQNGISSLRTVVDAIVRHTGIHVTADQALQVSLHLLGKARTHPSAPQRYVTAAIAKSPAEVQKHLYEQIGVAS